MPPKHKHALATRTHTHTLISKMCLIFLLARGCVSWCLYLPPFSLRWRKKKSRNLLLVTRGRRNKEKESDWRDLIDSDHLSINHWWFSATSLSFWFVPEVVALLLVGLIHATMAARSLWAKFAHRTYAGKVRSMPMTRCYIHGWATRETRMSAEHCADIKVSSAFYSVFQHLHFFGIVHPNISFRNRSDEL